MLQTFNILRSGVLEQRHTWYMIFPCRVSFLEGKARDTLHNLRRCLLYRLKAFKSSPFQLSFDATKNVWAVRGLGQRCHFARFVELRISRAVWRGALSWWSSHLGVIPFLMRGPGLRVSSVHSGRRPHLQSAQNYSKLQYFNCLNVIFILRKIIQLLIMSELSIKMQDNHEGLIHEGSWMFVRNYCRHIRMFPHCLFNDLIHFPKGLHGDKLIYAI